MDGMIHWQEGSELARKAADKIIVSSSLILARGLDCRDALRSK